MGQLKEQVVWITGAGTGIGEATALQMAKLGATVVLTGRRKAPLQAVAAKIKKAGGKAWVQSGDLSEAKKCASIAKAIDKKFGRLDILVNNAGMNILKRSWKDLDASGVDAVVNANLSSAFYCVVAALPIMRRRQGGLLIHTASWAGRFVSALAGPAYTAAKHAVVAMSYSINMEEFTNGIRSTVICPGEVATPIMDQRPVPVSKADREKMLQSEDVASSIVHVALAPTRVCVNEIVISPAWNRGYLRLGGHGVPDFKSSKAAKPTKKKGKAKKK